MSDFKPTITQEQEEHHDSGDDAIVRYMARLRLPRAEIEELVADVQEAFGDERGGLKAEFWKMRSVIERGFLVLRSYSNKGGDKDSAERCLWLLLGFPTLAGADSLADLIRLTKRNKATINKMLQHFQKQMPELPLLEGQRNEQSRHKMKQARLNQIKL